MPKIFHRNLLAGAIAAAGLIGNASADVIFNGSSGSLAASADFSIVGGNLQIVLTNTSSADVLVPTDVLTGLFFNLNGVGALTPVSASLNGSTVFYGSITNNLGEGYQYVSGVVLTGGATEGISAAGLGVFGPNGNFFTPGLTLDGLDYGLLSAGDNSATGNTGVTGHGPLIKDAVTFTLSGLPGGFTEGQLRDALSNVSLQYGTALTEPNIPVPEPEPAPEPGTLALLGLGLAGLAFKRQRSR